MLSHRRERENCRKLTPQGFVTFHSSFSVEKMKLGFWNTHGETVENVCVSYCHFQRRSLLFQKKSDESKNLATLPYLKETLLSTSDRCAREVWKKTYPEIVSRWLTEAPPDCWVNKCAGIVFRSTMAVCGDFRSPPIWGSLPSLEALLLQAWKKARTDLQIFAD